MGYAAHRPPSRPPFPLQHPQATSVPTPTELCNFPEGEVAEMVQLYTKKGLTETSARQVVETMATNHDFFVDVMMLEELQMPPPSEITEFQAAWRVGGSILVCGGTLPLCHALFSLSRPGTVAFSLTLGVAIAALAYLGALRASITHQVNDAASNPRLSLRPLTLRAPLLRRTSVASLCRPSRLSFRASFCHSSSACT